MFHICSPASSAACAPRCGAGRVVRQGAAAGGDAMLMMGMLLAAAAPVRLEPSSKWIVDFGAQGCAMARSFGTGADRLTIVWRVLPVRDLTQMVTEQKAPDTGRRRSTARVAIRQDGDVAVNGEEVLTEAFSYGNDGVRRQHLWVSTNIFLALPARPVLRIQPATGVPTDVPLPGIAKALDAIAACNADLLKSWSMDSAKANHVEVPAVSESKSVADWISYRDYPQSALDSGLIGTTSIVWLIEADGQVRNCQVAISSGTPAVDKAACDAIIRNGRYKPARDASGKPVSTLQSRTIVWSLPSDWINDAAARKFSDKRWREWQAKARAEKSAAKP